MARKKQKKRQKRYIEPGMSDIIDDEKIKKKGKKHIRKSKMPAHIKSTPRARQR
jgi:hypothetical protein